ncbi:MAG: dienelactone hydrolase family protein [Alphaproteobacteria bacterium]
MAVALFCGTGAGAGAQVSYQLVTFPSVTMTDREFLTGATPTGDITLAGILRVPNAEGKVPAVILLEHSAGLGAPDTGYFDVWASDLNALGIATLQVDSFTARNIVRTTFDQNQLGWLAMVNDAYRARDFLQQDQRIDPERIALMGFSRSAIAVVASTFDRFEAMHAGGKAFAAYIAMYPDCTARYKEDTAIGAQPVRIFMGELDDWTPIGPCRKYVAEAKAAGADIELTGYAGAYHVFDNPGLPSPAISIDGAATWRGCTGIAEGADGMLLNAAGQPFDSERDPCVQKAGTHFGYDAGAHAKAREDVGSFLREALTLE